MRVKIALRNLYISQAIIVAFLIYAYVVWFPHSFAELGGFKKTAFMLIVADLVLGPLLVFIVYREGKKYLAFDINVLLSIQLAAFAYGAYALYLKHPAYAVFTGDRFTLTNVSHLYPQQPALKQLKESFFSMPKIVVANAPDNLAEKNQLFFDVIFNGAPDIDHRPKYFEPVEGHTHELVTHTLTPEHLFFDEPRKMKLQGFIAKHGGTPQDYLYYPLSGNNKRDVVWVLDKQQVNPVGIIDIDPWLQPQTRQTEWSKVEASLVL